LRPSRTGKKGRSDGALCSLTGLRRRGGVTERYD
jgi:hypothetical protein